MTDEDPRAKYRRLPPTIDPEDMVETVDASEDNETPRDLNREQKEALKKFSETLGEGNYEKHRSFFGKKK